MRIFKLIKISFLSLSLLLSAGCGREDVDFIGPATKAPSDNFQISSFTTSATSIDLEANDLTIDATFNEAVSWIITVTGQESGAVWTSDGLSSTLSLTWVGGHSETQFFKTGETATVTVSFMGSDISSSIDVTITQAHIFDEAGLLPQYADFEGVTEANLVFPYWAIFTPISGYDVQQGLGSAETSYSGKTVTPVQGDQYLYMKGLGDANAPGFVTGTQCYILDAGYTPLPATPDDVWVNVYVWGDGNPNSRLDMELQEGDAGGLLPGYQGCEDDNYIATMILDHYGWKLFSFKYSDLSTNIYECLGNKGNKIHEPENLASLVFILIKDRDQTAVSEAYFEHPIFTVGGPFNPDM